MSLIARLLYTKRAAAEDIAKQAILDTESLGEQRTVQKLKGLKAEDPKLFELVVEELRKRGNPIPVPG